jgi:hypothetical protein
MDKPTSGEMKEQQSGSGKMSNPSTHIHLTVTPSTPSGNDVPISAAGTAPYVQSNGNITGLQQGQSYDITFTLAGANGVNSWRSNNPFANQVGSCPTPGQGASSPFSVNSNPSATSMTIHMDSQSSSSTTQYRLNFNGSYYCDPIIVVN